MPKIRQVKPELFTTESLPPSLAARWLFVGLLTEADDEGRLLDLPKRIAGALFPHDDLDGPAVDALLADLEGHGQVLRYEADGKRCLQIVNFRKHQYIPRPIKSRLPAPPSDTPPEQETCETHVGNMQPPADSLSGSSSSGVRDLGSSSSQDAVGEGEEEGEGAPQWALAEVERRYRANAGHIGSPRAWRSKVLADVLAEGPPKLRAVPPPREQDTQPMDPELNKRKVAECLQRIGRRAAAGVEQ